METNAIVSIIMGIFNCENTLKDSIESILNQTYTSWELIMCDDGSTDNTYNIANEYKKQYKDKIVLLKNSQNKGLSYTLNRCLNNSQGIYIARQDGDDISAADKIEKQVQFLEENIDYAFVSCGMVLFDEKGKWGRTFPVKKPEKNDFVKGTPFPHAACIIRKEAIMNVHGYRDIHKTIRVEDYDLWFRLYEKGYKGYNFSETLYWTRDDRNARARRKYIYRINEARVKYEGFKRLRIPKTKYVFIIKPLLIGLIPAKLYSFLRKRKHSKKGKI